MKYKVIQEVELTEQELNLLKSLYPDYLAEYRDTQFDTLEQFKNSKLKEIFSEQVFLERNHNGTYYLINNLLKYGLVESDGESWHLTYRITDFGKKLIEQNP